MKNNNKGFSLVELIVVIAIMAVLVGVLAPTLLRYVEKSRVQKDASAVAEVVEALKIAVADEDIAKEVATAGSVDVTVSTGSNPTCTPASLNAELGMTIGTVTFSSAKADTVTVTVSIDDATSVPSFSVAAGSNAGADWKAAVEAVH